MPITGGETTGNEPRTRPGRAAGRAAGQMAGSSGSSTGGSVQDLLSAIASYGSQMQGQAAGNVPAAEAALQTTLASGAGSLATLPGETYAQAEEDNPIAQFMLTGGRSTTPLTQEEQAATPAVQEAQARVELARDLQRRRAVGSDVAGPYKPGTPAPGAQGNKVHEMTMRRYEALSPKERAAVDFNTLLVQAVEADAANQKQYDPSEQQRKTYDALVTKAFGEDDQTDYYAPEVMGLLQQIGFQDDAAKLQDFLGLNAAITKGDLKNLPDDSPYMGIESDMVSPVHNDRYQLMNSLASSTRRMEEQMAKTNDLLASIPESARLANMQYIADQLGATPAQPDQIYGYGGDETSQLFQKGYGVLATKSNQADKDLILTQLNDQLSPAQFKEFLKYVDVRSANAQQYGLALSDVAEGQDPKALFTPEKFRVFMGLDEGYADG